MAAIIFSLVAPCVVICILIDLFRSMRRDRKELGRLIAEGKELDVTIAALNAKLQEAMRRDFEKRLAENRAAEGWIERWRK